MTDMTPAQMAEMDQMHAAALADLETLVDDARRLVAAHGVVGAPGFLVGELFEAADQRAENGLVFLGGVAALALIELARREATS